MASHVGGKELAKEGIHGPADLLPLPWDKTTTSAPLTDEDRQRLQADMEAFAQSKT